MFLERHFSAFCTDGVWYVNEYERDDRGDTRRETVLDNLTEEQAQQAVAELDMCWDRIRQIFGD